MVAILRFTLPSRKEWSPAEQAEFVRAAAILRGTGLPVICETGVSDEGDPWVIFLREDTGDVIAHIAKIDGQVMAASAATGDVVCGPSFRTVMDKVVRSQPLVLPSSSLGDRVHLHPSTVIIAFIATALAWSLEDDGRLYDWKVDADGTVALVGGGRDSSGNVLRDSLFSKAEASRLGLDAQGQNLSSSLVVAAALAAVAIAAKSMELLGDDDSRQAAAPDTTDRAFAAVAHDNQAVPTDPQSAVPEVATTHGSSGGEQLDIADLDSDGQLWRGLTDGVAPHNIKLLFDAGRVAELPDLPVLPTDKASLADGLIETVSLRTLPPISEVSAQDTPASIAVTVPKSEVDAPAASVAPVAHALPPVPQGQGLSITLHGTPVTLSPEVIKLFLSPELAFGQSRATFLDGPDSHQPSTGGAFEASGLLVVADEPTTPPPVQAADTSSGYKTIDDILWFAADQRHEVHASAPAIESLNAKLASLAPFLPWADRILIVDIPEAETYNDIFKLVPGLNVMLQTTAEKLMPSLALHAQAELTLTNGETVKLMGVIDLNDYHPTAHG